MRKLLVYATRVSALSLLALLCAAALQAQQTEITGVVLSPAGDALANATVAIHNDANGFSRTVATDNTGHFTATGLAAAPYRIEITAPGFKPVTQQLAAGASTKELSISLPVADVTQTMTVEAALSIAVEIAPSQASLDARSAESIISRTYIQNFISPVGDYSDVIQMSPGTFSVSPNGQGLGDTKTFFRGFKDGFYNMTFDGLPFNDTNDPTHHSWAWFPSPFIGSTVFDRSPGDATVIGPANSGGSINLQSKELMPDQVFTGTVSYGSFNTRLLEADYNTGAFGGAKRKNNLSLDVHQMTSDGYQTYNFMNRTGGSAKYQHKFTDRTVLTAFSGILQLTSNTPNIKGPTRAAVDQFGLNYLLNNDPNDPLYYKYSQYNIPSDFEYVSIKTDQGRWQFEDKWYTNRYYNHQQYNGTTITPTSGTDKLNSYRKYGNNMSASYEMKWGVFRTGLWYELAYTDRYQTPTDPRTWLNAPGLPNFHEKFITQSTQPFAQYEFRPTSRLSMTVGVKMSNYKMHLNQFADNGKTIGNLGGVDFVTHDGKYHAWQPTADIRYRLKSYWTTYAQYATGNVIPPSNVFDVKNATVAVTPKPTQTKAFQFGSVLKFNRFTLDMDAYFIKAQSPYASAPDPVTGNPVYYLTGNTLSKGFEAEGNIVIGHGFNAYMNGTIGTAKYQDTGLWVASAPNSTLTEGLTYLHRNWDIGFFNKRIGTMYNDNGSAHQAVKLDPFNITNLFFNYTLKGESHFRGTKFRLTFNNLLNKHNIVGITPGSTASSAPSPKDQLAIMAGRSIALSVTFGYAPKR